MPLILASASQIRRTMLDQAGIEHIAVAADLDEGAVKAKHDNPVQGAIELASAKALAVSAEHPGAWVIGSDSMVTVGGRSFDKPASREEAADHLRVFSGKSMTLTSAVALARDRSVDWAEADQATLKVRPLSEAFIQSYLDADWPGVGQCVGVFRLEGPGVQLFDSISGDHFTVLGMPLLPLLNALRMRGLVPS